jgi:RNA polymerase sigma-70 factor (ECF subfamily)
MPLLPAQPSAPRLASVHRLRGEGGDTPALAAAGSPTARLGQADDAALACAAIEGHPAAAGVVWDRFSSLVRGLLRRSLGPQNDVEDQVQEVFLRFFSQVGGLRDPSALRSFLIGITIRVAGTELRRRRMRRWLHLTESGSVPEDETVAEDDDAREALARLYALLDRIDDGSRLAFVLRHIQGLELTDVAVALDISLATTKRRLAKVTARVFATAVRDPILREYLAADASVSVGTPRTPGREVST